MVLKLVDTDTLQEFIISDDKLIQLYKHNPDKFMKFIEVSSFILDSLVPVIHNDKLDLVLDTFITGGNSAKNGKIGEIFASQHFSKCCPYIQYTDTSGIPKSGDAIIDITNHQIGKIMIDYKNYTNVVSSEEVLKLIKDMDTQNICYGLFISYHSRVSRKKYIDYEIHNGKLIVYLTCCEMNFLMIDMAIQYLIRLYECNLLDKSQQAYELVFHQSLSEIQKSYEKIFEITQTHCQHINTIKECYEKSNKLFTKILSNAIETKTSLNSVLYSMDERLQELHRESECTIDSYDTLYYQINSYVDKDKDRIYGKQVLDLSKELDIKASYCEKDKSIHFHNKGKLQLFKHRLTMIFYSYSNEIQYNREYECVKNNNYYINLSDNQELWKIIHRRFISVN